MCQSKILKFPLVRFCQHSSTWLVTWAMRCGGEPGCLKKGSRWERRWGGCLRWFFSCCFFKSVQIWLLRTHMGIKVREGDCRAPPPPPKKQQCVWDLYRVWMSTIVGVFFGGMGEQILPLKITWWGPVIPGGRWGLREGECIWRRRRREGGEEGAHSEQLKKGEGGGRKREAGVVLTWHVCQSVEMCVEPSLSVHTGWEALEERHSSCPQIGFTS